MVLSAAGSQNCGIGVRLLREHTPQPSTLTANAGVNATQPPAGLNSRTPGHFFKVQVSRLR